MLAIAVFILYITKVLCYNKITERSMDVGGICFEPKAER